MVRHNSPVDGGPGGAGAEGLACATGRALAAVELPPVTCVQSAMCRRRAVDGATTRAVMPPLQINELNTLLYELDSLRPSQQVQSFRRGHAHDLNFLLSTSRISRTACVLMVRLLMMN